jgi:hypothetical protein
VRSKQSAKQTKFKPAQGRISSCFFSQGARKILDFSAAQPVHSRFVVPAQYTQKRGLSALRFFLFIRDLGT